MWCSTEIVHRLTPRIQTVTDPTSSAEGTTPQRQMEPLLHPHRRWLLELPTQATSSRTLRWPGLDLTMMHLCAIRLVAAPGLVAPNMMEMSRAPHAWTLEPAKTTLATARTGKFQTNNRTVTRCLIQHTDP